MNADKKMILRGVSRALQQAGVLTVSASLTVFPVLSYATDLADVPLASQATTAVKPNILFVLDDSGSMDWDYMPDEMGSEEYGTAFKSSACNTVYFNPSITYKVPKSSTGVDYANSTFTSAETNGFNTAGSNTNLSTSFKAHGSDTSQAAYYYTVSPTPATNSDACLSAPTSSSASTHTVSKTHGTTSYTWTKVQVSGAQQQNFANWYSYYRTRMLMMKTAAGLAFQSISSNYRVGFITINPTYDASGTYQSSVQPNKYLKISDFDTAQRALWYTKLYDTVTDNSTPLREALSRAGWIYAGKLNTGLTSGIPTADDPVQYSCQQTFTILTTDGYWNGASGKDLAGASFSGVSTDSDVSLTPKPMHDGASTTTYTQKDDVTTTYAVSTCKGGGSRLRKTVTTVTTVTPPGTVTSNAVGPTTVINCTTPAPADPPDTFTSTTTTFTAATGGATNTLADVAEYYYRTDLRTTTLGTNMNHAATPIDVSENNVPKSGSGTEDDKANWQHMTTFTLGLGLFGTLQFASDYKTDTTPGTTFNQIRAGTLNWPDPAGGVNQRADDLWHTAVNGRGLAFSAANPDAVVSGLTTALAGVNARVGSAAAAATSNLEPVAGDNFAYTASYETQTWVGDVQSREIDLATGIVSTTPVWSTSTKLNLRTGLYCDTRSIKLFRSGATDNLVNFTLATDTCNAGTQTASGTTATALDGTESGWYAQANLTTLSQFDTATSGMTAAQKTAAAGANMVNFIRGQRGYEGYTANDVNALYRTRTNVMGDIINAQPVFVKSAVGKYTDTGYDTFRTSGITTTRAPMVYVASNAGMLHAFYAGTSTSDTQGGEERWAYIPRMVAPNLWKLSDNNYKNLHQFSVDGTPTVADVYDTATSSWKTILVAGLNKGGKGFYALDITDPGSPKGLWEFGYSATCYDGTAATAGADCNMGYSYGNPSIAKLSNGTWVVFLTSGYNNDNSAATGDGQGFLYVVNAITGQIIKKIGTGTGSTAAPSGLGKINTWVDNASANNTAVRVYGGDLAGNLWRFDVNGAAASGSTAVRITTFEQPAGTAQSISTKPVLAEINAEPYVYVATGRYLGTTDIGNNPVQSIYAIKDTLTSTAYATPRTTLKKNTIGTTTGTVTAADGTTSTQTIRTSTCTTNCSSTSGWFVDLPDTGERVNVDMKLQLGTLTVASNVPQNNACNIGGYSYINFFNYADGLAVPTSTNAAVGYKLSDSLAVGINIVRLPSGKTVAIATTSDAQQQTVNVPTAGDALSGRRVSWRELGE